MSTKNLARTVIEGGRDVWSRRFRHHTNRQLRVRERGVLASLASGGDADEMIVPRTRAYRHFDDKLAPSRRWLGRQVGRPWDAVRSELLRRFDTRTTAGRHIVFCHMLPWVEDDGTLPWRPFRVDRQGILRARAPRPRYVSPCWRAPLGRDERELETWLAGRRVGARGVALFWFTPTARGGYRQHHRLTDDDDALWRSLPEWFREQHLPTAPPPTPTQ